MAQNIPFPQIPGKDDSEGVPQKCMGFWLSVPKRKLTEAWQIRKTVDRNLVEWFHINNFDSVSDGLAFF